jgi:hypothetical protein
MEYLGVLLSMVLNFPLATEVRLMSLKLAKEKIASTIRAIEAKEEKGIGDAEKRVVAFSQEVVAALADEMSFETLTEEVKATVVQLHVEAEKTKNK